MPHHENTTLADAIEHAVNVEIFIDNFNIKYGVARPITRQIIAEVGISLPKIYDELRRLGYPVPPRENI